MVYATIKFKPVVGRICIILHLYMLLYHTFMESFKILKFVVPQFIKDLFNFKFCLKVKNVDVILNLGCVLFVEI